MVARRQTLTVQKNKDLRLRRFIAKYIRYVEVFGYAFVALLAAGILFACFYKVDEVVKHDKDPEIRPKETVVKTKGDAFVTRVFVTEAFQPVSKGQPLAEIVDDPAWVERLRAVAGLRSALKAWSAQDKARADAAGAGAAQTPPAPAAVGTPTVQGTPEAADLALRRSVEQALAAWERTGGAQAPRQIVAAPHDGVVVFDEQLPGQVVAGDKEILKVADFNELQVKANLKGDEVSQVRVGQTARIEVRPLQPPNRALRGDLERGFGRAERVQFTSLIDDPLKNWLRDELKKTTISDKNKKDIPLEVVDIEKIEASAPLETTPAALDGGDVLKPDTLHLLELRGRVVEAKHTGKMTLPALPPAVDSALRGRLLEKMKGKVVAHDPPFRVEDFASLAVATQVKVAATTVPKDDAERRRLLDRSLEANKDERGVEATLVLEDPPLALRQAIEAQYKQATPSGPRVNVDVITDRRPFAAFLFQ